MTVIERNRPDDTFGFGVVFSDATMQNFAQPDPATYAAMRRAFAHWDDVEIRFGANVIRSTGHGFAGLGRRELLDILQDRCRELGVQLRFEEEVSDSEIADLRAHADLVVGADGVASRVREVYADAFGPSVHYRPNWFAWLGTTLPLDAFTFLFKENEHGLWRVHAYPYGEGTSTFLVECTADTFERTGLSIEDEDATIAYLGEVFREELGQHKLLKNRSIWRQFPVIRNNSWCHENIVLVGDAVHTAHFSIGSGTKLAMEDIIDLCQSLKEDSDVPTALKAYERRRKPVVERLQSTAEISMEWFEKTEQYMKLEPMQFAASLLTRSQRITHGNLAERDPVLVQSIDAAFADSVPAPGGPDLPMDRSLDVGD